MTTLFLKRASSCCPYLLLKLSIHVYVILLLFSSFDAVRRALYDLVSRQPELKKKVLDALVRLYAADDVAVNLGVIDAKQERYY